MKAKVHTHTFYDFEIMIAFMRPRCNRDDVLEKVQMAEDCRQGECLVNLNGRIMIETNEIHRIPDGSAVRIWYTVFPKVGDPVNIPDEAMIAKDAEAEGGGRAQRRRW